MDKFEVTPAVTSTFPMNKRSGAGRRILIVEDDDSTRDLLQAIFRPLEIEIGFANDGRAALSLLHNEKFDAVVLDLFLPKVNGFEILREMKATQPALLPRTMVLTAAGPKTLQDFPDGKLISCVMRKPFDLNGLVDAVLTCCAASKKQPPRVGN